ncbi:hypothetical protein HX056_17290 [Myroides odoratimimus]|uniref:hypothetical protein n=1 Tax=Myroides odoratimimus TaxID=76832 RepID=UPI002577420C|nr:hypothetical protein [Myroides odoratimimus]MDM1445044.1 hypothetical protein [Myroides odoratimimus]
MKVYQTVGILGMIYLGLCSTSVVAQKKEKVDVSAAMPTDVKPQDISKLNYTYAVEVENKLYSGYSLAAINPKSIEHIKAEQGVFQVGTTTYDKKIVLPLKDGNKSTLIVLDQWAKQNISFAGKLIFMLDGVVLNAKPNTVLLDQNYVVDYMVTPLDQLGFDQATALVQLRMKTVDNFKAMTKAQKEKRKK